MKNINSFFLIMMILFILSCESDLFNKGKDTPENNPGNNGSGNEENVPPVARGQIILTGINTQANITLTAADSNGDQLSWHKDSDPAHGNLSGTMPQITYTPTTDYTGSDSFTFHVNDRRADSNVATISITVSGTGTWEENVISNLPVAYTNIVVGDGRNDANSRLYSSAEDDIYEYTYVTDHWERYQITGVDLSTIYTLVIGEARNDGDNGIYATGYNQAEYYYNSAWSGLRIGPWTQWIYNLDIGAARNDNVNRIYLAGGVSGDTCDYGDCITEVSYDFGDWNDVQINTGNLGISKLIVADGRNDGIMRIYAAISLGKNIYEFTWTGSDWLIKDCGTVVPDYTSIWDCDLVAGDGRNDGKNRIYFAHETALIELSYNEETLIWGKTTITDSIAVDHIKIASVRDDGLNRIYTGTATGIGEYAYGGTWKKTSNITTSFQVDGIAIGNGRSDGVNRIYVTGNNSIYEYSPEQ